MKVSSKSRYALLALVELDQRTRGSRRPVRLTDLAHERDIPEQFLEQLFAALRRAGLITGHRGVGGGFTFARRPDQLTVLDVVQALDGAARARRLYPGRLRPRGAGRRRRRLAGRRLRLRGRARPHHHRRPGRAGAAGRRPAGLVPDLTDPRQEQPHEDRRRHHRPDRRHPAGQAARRLRADRRDGRRQARVLQPRRQRQGPHRPRDDRGGRGGRAHLARQDASSSSRPAATPASRSPSSRPAAATACS